MSLSTLRADLGTKIDRRESVATQLRDVRGRSADAETARSRAEEGALDADRAYRAALEAEAAGDPVRATTLGKLKETALAAWREHDARKDAVTAASKVIARLEDEHRTATRATAQSAEAVAVAIAEVRRQRYRAAVTVMAQEARSFHAACYAADRARHAATGQVGGEPVAHTGSAHARLAAAGDEGIDGILRANGIGIDWMPLRTRIDPLSESDLLAAEDDNNHDEGAPLKTGAHQ